MKTCPVPTNSFPRPMNVTMRPSGEREGWVTLSEKAVICSGGDNGSDDRSRVEASQPPAASRATPAAAE